MKTFDTGATRDEDYDKLNYADGLSEQVDERYLLYLQKHRTLPDGSLRAWNNWKKGIPKDRYRQSLMRHVRHLNKKLMGLPVPEDASLEDLCCAVRFNVDGLLFELLVAQSGNRELDNV